MQAEELGRLAFYGVISIWIYSVAIAGYVFTSQGSVVRIRLFALATATMNGVCCEVQEIEYTRQSVVFKFFDLCVSYK